MKRIAAERDGRILAQRQAEAEAAAKAAAALAPVAIGVDAIDD
jgi:hypothetical protein